MVPNDEIKKRTFDKSWLLKISLCLIAAFLGMQVVMWGWLLWRVSEVTTNGSVIEMLSDNEFTESIDKWKEWYMWVSLGTYRLPVVYDAYVLVDSTSKLLVSVQELAERGEYLSKEAIAGNRTERREWEKMFDEMRAVDEKLGVIDNDIKNPWLEFVLKRLASEQLQLVEKRLKQAREMIRAGMEWEEMLPVILGFEGKQHVIVLTQNNMELWPTGGYLGSYVSFWMDNGALMDLKVEDIGVPNGQIKGYVEAPEPISLYTHNGGTPGWRLRESNWDPDFTKARDFIEWFFVEGGVEPVDVMVATNMIPVREMLKVLGPQYVDDYDVTITHENMYEEIQLRTSYGFFDGSTQKRDFLGALGRRIIMTLTQDERVEIDKFLPVIVNQIDERQIMISAKDERVAKKLADYGWDGGLEVYTCADVPGCLGDYVYVNEANVGINKTNCCLDREFVQKIKIRPNDNVVDHVLELKFVNHNPPIPNPPENWGGGYKAYIRVHVPVGADLESISYEQEDIDKELIDVEQVGDYRVFGFAVLVPGEKEGMVKVNYSVMMDLPEIRNYRLMMQKQSGVESIPWRVEVHKEDIELASYDLELRADEVLQIPVGMDL